MDKLHRIILGDKPGYVIDHINGQKFDHRRRNLRHCTLAQNSYNKSSFGKNYVGVYKNSKGKFYAKFTSDGIIHKSTQVFETELEASYEADKISSGLWGEYARLNHPGPSFPHPPADTWQFLEESPKLNIKSISFLPASNGVRIGQIDEDWIAVSTPFISNFKDFAGNIFFNCGGVYKKNYNIFRIPICRLDALCHELDDKFETKFHKSFEKQVKKFFPCKPGEITHLNISELIKKTSNTFQLVTVIETDVKG
jgi:hypothetical protein